MRGIMSSKIMTDLDNNYDNCEDIDVLYGMF